MAQLVVRNLEEEVKVRLKKRAVRHGWSMEEEIRQILSKAVSEPQHERDSQGLGSRIAGLFSGVGLETELPELKGNDAKPMPIG